MIGKYKERVLLEANLRVQILYHCCDDLQWTCRDDRQSLQWTCRDDQCLLQVSVGNDRWVDVKSAK